MNLPNKLTVLRIILVAVFMFFLFMRGVPAKVFALMTFLAASFTDILDGYIAKKYNIVTDFGRLMDPIADKILVLSAFLAFVEMELVPAWMVVVIIFRDVAVTGLRMLALAKGKVISADEGGKHKMVSQVFAILAILFFLIFREGGMDIFHFWSASTEYVYKDAIFILMLLTTLLTLISGMSYLIRNREVYFNAKSH
ncbi:MAG: CDP-diacylglycerol--glycerol-3-phosphate 3-phosphatidyltransferase [Candidatus Omnitrophota bacterium]|jgi:CDP-diacylglycerol--glycerol-3-phosphate 3-phosphatidyltransferase|nr:CDP-diacylglycerol--glycerol-3-phosphate 3-phosphatidyltransferase [Candidatus Omnitrophota bacterium]